MSKHEHEQMVRALARPGTDLFKVWTPVYCHITHMAFGLVLEVLELDQALKEPTTDLTDVIEELGDIEFFLEGIYHGYGYIKQPTRPCLRRVTLSTLKAAAECVGTQVKRHIYYSNSQADVEGTLQTFTDVLCGFYETLGIARNDVLQANITKLRKRYGTAFSTAAATARRDKNPGT